MVVVEYVKRLVSQRVQRTDILYFSASEKYVCSSAPPCTRCSPTAMRERFGVDGRVKLDYDINVW
jgi:hypothetical protein